MHVVYYGLKLHTKPEVDAGIRMSRWNGLLTGELTRRWVSWNFYGRRQQQSIGVARHTWYSNKRLPYSHKQEDIFSQYY